MAPARRARFVVCASLLAVGACSPSHDRTDAALTSRTSIPADTLPNSGPASMPSISPSSAELDELREQVSALRRELAELRGASVRAPANGFDEATVRDPRAARSAAQVDAMQAERLRVVQAESAFRAEPSDARWSTGMAVTVRNTLSEAGGDSAAQVGSIECRSQTCRVELSGDVSGTSPPDLLMLVGRLGQSLPHAAFGQIDRGDGRPVTVMYLTR